MNDSKDHKAAADPPLVCLVGRWRVKVHCIYALWLADSGNTMQAEDAKTWPSHIGAKRAAQSAEKRLRRICQVEAVPNVESNRLADNGQREGEKA